MAHVGCGRAARDREEDAGARGRVVTVEVVNGRPPEQVEIFSQSKQVPGKPMLAQLAATAHGQT
jgi:hypothetical protein